MPAKKTRVSASMTIDGERVVWVPESLRKGVVVTGHWRVLTKPQGRPPKKKAT